MGRRVGITTSAHAHINAHENGVRSIRNIRLWCCVAFVSPTPHLSHPSLYIFLSSFLLSLFFNSFVLILFLFLSCRVACVLNRSPPSPTAAASAVASLTGASFWLARNNTRKSVLCSVFLLDFNFTVLKSKTKTHTRGHTHVR